MKTAFRKSFARDLKKIADDDILARVRQIIEDVEEAAGLRDIQQSQENDRDRQRLS